MMPSRARHPWSADDCNLLSDMVADGYPVKAIAHALGRSTAAITGMCKKAGLRILRGATVERVICLKRDADDILGQFARLRKMTVNTYERMTLEMAARSPEWLTKLWDTDMVERNEEEPLPVVVRKPKAEKIVERETQILREVGAGPMLVTARLGSPQLVGSVH
jgi:hypothetical protein